MMSRTFAVALVVAANLVVAFGSASASCSGPTIKHDAGPVDRHETVQVVGTAWGDNCYDTGPPPEGESQLGRPVEDIEIFLVQEGVEHLVATGNADANFEFRVDVTVPDELSPGPVEVRARSPLDVSTYNSTRDVLVVSERPPTGVGDDAPLRFGPSERPRADDEGSASVDVAAVAAVALLIAGLATTLFYVARRRRA